MELQTKQQVQYQFILTKDELEDEKTFGRMKKMVRGLNGTTPIHHSEPKAASKSTPKSNMVKCPKCKEPFKRAGLKLHMTRMHSSKPKPKINLPVE